MTQQKTYNWICNIKAEELAHTKTCMQLIGADYQITPIAKDFTGHILPGYQGVWLATGQDPDLEARFFEVFSKLCQKYKAKLLATGNYTEEELSNKVIYIGCEKDYFPERTEIGERDNA